MRILASDLLQTFFPRFGNLCSMEFLARSVHCEVCFKFFKSDIQLKKHHRNIHDKRTCELCNKEISAGNFNRHKKEHHLVLDSLLSGNFNCDKCKSSFTRKDKLIKHETTCKQMSKDPLSQFQCNICGVKGFSTKKTLKSHVKSHQDERVGCSECGNHYANKKLLKRHMKSKHPRLDVIVEEQT